MEEELFVILTMSVLASNFKVTNSLNPSHVSVIKSTLCPKGLNPIPGRFWYHPTPCGVSIESSVTMHGH